MGFMCLNIFPVFISTVAIVINDLSSDDGTWAQGQRNTIQMREGIQPVNSETGKLNSHMEGKFREGQSVIASAHPLFDSMNVLS